jgi:F-box and leucine-rich repeat protein 14
MPRLSAVTLEEGELSAKAWGALFDGLGGGITELCLRRMALACGCYSKGMRFFRQLTRLCGLQTLQIKGGCSMYGSDLHNLTALSSLRRVEINSKAVSDASVAKLAQIPGLQRLELFTCIRVTGAGLTALTQCTTLQHLVLMSRALGCVDLGILTQALPDLQHLALGRLVALAEKSAAPLAALTSLSHLSLTAVPSLPSQLTLPRVAWDASGVAVLQGLRHLALCGDTAGFVEESAMQTLPGLERLALVQVHREPNWSGMAHLHSLTMRTCFFNGMSRISVLTSLQRLIMDSCCESHKHALTLGYSALASFTMLTYLDLSSPMRCDVDMQAVAALHNLQNLGLAFCDAVEGSSLQQLTALTGLCGLDLSRTATLLHASPGIGADHIVLHVAQMTRLRRLNLGRCLAVCDAGLAQLAALTALEELHLAECKQVSDAGLGHLSGLARLKRIELGGTAVQDTALMQLTHLASLSCVSVSKIDAPSPAIALIAITDRLLWSLD